MNIFAKELNKILAEQNQKFILKKKIRIITK